MLNLNIEPMTGRTGKPVPNQYIISDVEIAYKSKTGEIIRPPKGRLFRSYKTNIAFIGYDGSVFLDDECWNYSVTTSKYRNIFLNETKKETERKIKEGVYKLVDLN